MSILSARSFSLPAMVLCVSLGAVGCVSGIDGNAAQSFADFITADNPEEVVLLAFENQTGFDLSIGFEIDGVFGGVLVFDGETLLLERDCFTTIELLFEDRFDPQTGVFVEGLDLVDTLSSNPADFRCGDVLIFTFSLPELSIATEPLSP